MALKTGKKDNKELIKIILVVVLFGVMGFLIYNNFVNEEVPVDSGQRPLAQSPGLTGQSVRDIEDLQNMQTYLDSLIKIGDWPVQYEFESVSGDYGRSNPFLPLE
jgi:hypothetical protein